MLFLNPGAAGREGFHQVKTCVRLYAADGKADARGGGAPGRGARG